MPRVASAPGSSSASTRRASLVRPPPPRSSSRRRDWRSRRSSIAVAPPIREVSKRHGRLGRQRGRVQGHGVGIQQRPDRDLVADGGFGHRNPDRDALAGEVALQLAELAAVADDHGDVTELPAVVELGLQDPLRHVPQFVDRRRQQVRSPDGCRSVAARRAGPSGWRRAAPAGARTARRPGGRCARPRTARPPPRPGRGGARSRAAVPGRSAGRGEQPGKLGHEVRAGAAEALDHGVRRGGDDGVLARGDVREQFEHGRVGFLHVVHQDQLEPVAFGGEEVRFVLEDLAGRGDDAGRVEGLGHAQVQHVAVFRVQCGRGNPVRPVAAPGRGPPGPRRSARIR